IEQKSVQYFSRQTQGAKGQGLAQCRFAIDQAHPPDGHCACGLKVDAERLQIAGCFPADEFATDFVLRFALAFQQADFASLSRQQDGHGAAGRATADHCVVYCLRHETQSRKGKYHCTCACSASPARRSMRCQSSRTKARATDRAASLRTRRLRLNRAVASLMPW